MRWIPFVLSKGYSRNMSCHAITPLSLSLSLSMLYIRVTNGEDDTLVPDFNAFTVLKIVFERERESGKETTRKCQIPASPTQVVENSIIGS
jgi:hypothetical protein